jgi:hypothetical protein
MSASRTHFANPNSVLACYAIGEALCSFPLPPRALRSLDDRHVGLEHARVAAGTRWGRR